MRQQRMLREELREKKKELEDMMRKDPPRKQYSRNQDTQSDNVSFSNRSDALGWVWLPNVITLFHTTLQLDVSNKFTFFTI